MAMTVTEMKCPTPRSSTAVVSPTFMLQGVVLLPTPLRLKDERQRKIGGDGSSYGIHKLYLD